MQDNLQSLEIYTGQLHSEISKVEQREADEIGKYKAIQLELEEKLTQTQKELEWKNQVMAQLKYVNCF